MSSRDGKPLAATIHISGIKHSVHFYSHYTFMHFLYLASKRKDEQ